MFHVRFINHHNIFFACLMGPIFVKHNSVGHIFVKHHPVDSDATKIESKTILESHDSVSDAVEAT